MCPDQSNIGPDPKHCLLKHARKFTFCLVLYKDEKVLESVETLRSEASSDMSRAPRRTSRLSTSGRHKVLAT